MVSILFRLAPILALLFLVFTDAGRALAADLFAYAHERLTAYLTRVLEESIR